MRFVTPAVVRIPIGNGDWIEVKRELTVGEERRYRAAGLRRVSGVTGGAPGETSIDVDWTAMAFARVEAYLVDWSAKKPDGKDLPVTPQAIGALATEDFDEIDRAIQRHVEAMAEEKKLTSGELTPQPTSA